MKRVVSVLLATVGAGGLTATVSAEMLLHSHSEGWGTLSYFQPIDELSLFFGYFHDDFGEVYLTEFGTPILDENTPAHSTYEFILDDLPQGALFEQLATNGDGFDELEFGFDFWAPAGKWIDGFAVGNVDQNWTSPDGTTDLKGYDISRVVVTIDNFEWIDNPNWQPGSKENWWGTQFSLDFTLDYYGTKIPAPSALVLMAAGFPAFTRRRRRQIG